MTLLIYIKILRREQLAGRSAQFKATFTEYLLFSLPFNCTQQWENFDYDGLQLQISNDGK